MKVFPWLRALAQRLRPPVFADEERTRRAAALHVLLLFIVLVIVGVGGPGLLFIFQPKLPAGLALGGLALALGLAYRLNQVGRVRLAAVGTVTTIWAVITAMVMVTQGIRSYSLPFHISGTLVAGILLGAEGGWVYAVAAALVSLGAMGLNRFGGLEWPNWFVFSDDTLWVLLVMNLLCAVAPLSLILQNLETALARTRREVAERRQTEAALHRRVEQLNTLNRISQAINQVHDLTTVYEVALAQMQTALPIGAFYVALYDAPTQWLTFPLFYDAGQFWPETGKPLDPAAWTAGVVLHGETRLVNRTLAEIEAQRPVTHELLGDTAQISASLMFVPLQMNDRVIGLVSAQSYSLNAYDADDLVFLGNAANQIAIAIENARLYENLEQRVAERTVALEASHRDLESLSYNIAHDMRAPVRALVGYSQLLSESPGVQLDEEGRGYVGQMHRSARRLGRLIDDFVIYLQVGRSAVRCRTVNCAEILEPLLAAAQAPPGAAPIEFVVGALPLGYADPVLLARVWQVLLDNALKFTRAPIRIEIGAQDKDGVTTYFVRDNGIGFKMQYAHKIFEVFQHLNRLEDYEGTGMGLAIAQRILQRHGGRIWAEAEPDKGATFYFTLPWIPGEQK